MKNLDHNRNEFDQNWRWPEKTWFQERLKAVKAREREAQQNRDDIPQDCAKPMRAETEKRSGKPKRKSTD